MPSTADNSIESHGTKQPIWAMITSKATCRTAVDYNDDRRTMNVMMVRTAMAMVMVMVMESSKPFLQHWGQR